jgi:hypothetical protein
MRVRPRSKRVSIRRCQKLANGLRSPASRDVAKAARLSDQPAGAQPARTVSSGHVRPGQTSKVSAALPEDDGRTAIYDITARMVYLPGGRRLEAHSGLGDSWTTPVMRTCGCMG